MMKVEKEKERYCNWLSMKIVTIQLHQLTTCVAQPYQYHACITKKQQSSLLYGKQAAEINEHCFLDHEKQEADGVVLHCQIYSINTLCVCSASAGEKQG